MINVVPFHKNHLDLFVQRPIDIELYGKITSENCPTIFEYGQCFTVLFDGRIVLIGGIIETSKHTGKCSTILSLYAELCLAELFRSLKEHMENMMRSMAMHRIETSSPKDAHDQRKWCKLLGFLEEGEMQFYDDQGRTYIRLAKTMRLDHDA